MEIPEATWRPKLSACVTHLSTKANGGDRWWLYAHLECGLSVRVCTTKASGKRPEPLDCFTTLGALVGEHCQCTHTSQLGKHHLTGTVDVTSDTKRRGPRRASEIEVRVLTPTPT